MFKPVNVTVGSAATLLAPAVAPKSTDIGAWAALTAVAVGAIVQTEAGDRYWCVGAGTTGSTAPSHTDGDATDGSVTWRRCHGRRAYLALINGGEEDVYLGIGEAAVSLKGIRLNAGGGTIEFRGDDQPVPQGKLWGITASGTAVVGIQEG